MSMQHLEYMCNVLNYGVEGEQELTTTSNIGHWWDVDTAAVVALGPEWQFAPEDSYDPTDLPLPATRNRAIITGNDGKCAWHFMLTRP